MTDVVAGDVYFRVDWELGAGPGSITVAGTQEKEQSAFVLFQTVLEGLQQGNPVHIAGGHSVRDLAVEVYDRGYLPKLGCFCDLLMTIWNIFLRCIGCVETEVGQVATLAETLRTFPLVSGNYPLSAVQQKMGALARALLNIPIEHRDTTFYQVQQNPQEYPFWEVDGPAAAFDQMSADELWAYFDRLHPYLQVLNRSYIYSQGIHTCKALGLELSLIRALDVARAGDTAAALARISNEDNVVTLQGTDPGVEAMRSLMHLCWSRGDIESLNALFALNCMRGDWNKERVEFANRILAGGEISEAQSHALLSIIRRLAYQHEQAGFIATISARFLHLGKLHWAFDVAKLLGVSEDKGRKCHQDLIDASLEAGNIRLAIDVARALSEAKLEEIVNFCLEKGQDEDALAALGSIYDQERLSRLVTELTEKLPKAGKAELAAQVARYAPVPLIVF